MQIEQAYQYRKHILVILERRAVIYRDSFLGEGSPRINDLRSDRPFGAALAWFDGPMFPTPKPGSVPVPIRTLDLPRFVTEDLADPRPLYFVIEHPSRGCFVGWTEARRPRFRWAIPRTHPAILRYSTRAHAEQVFSQINHQARRCQIITLHA